MGKAASKRGANFKPDTGNHFLDMGTSAHVVGNAASGGAGIGTGGCEPSVNVVTDGLPDPAVHPESAILEWSRCLSYAIFTETDSGHRQ